MRKITLLLFVHLLFCVTLTAQEKQTESIKLKNGEIYQGEIVLRTAEIVMLKTADGRRYQFQTSEIEKIGLENTATTTKNELHQTNQGNFAGIATASGGLAAVPATNFGTSQALSVSLAFGSRNAFGTSAFAGVGAGYLTVFGNETQQNLSYIPLFIQTNIPLNDTKISPAIGTKAGYMFTLNDRYQGGVFFNISGGMNYKLTSHSSFYAALYAQAQRISGTVIERNEFGEFTRQGNTMIYSLGISTAFLF